MTQVSMFKLESKASEYTCITDLIFWSPCIYQIYRHREKVGSMTNEVFALSGKIWITLWNVLELLLANETHINV